MISIPEEDFRTGSEPRRRARRSFETDLPSSRLMTWSSTAFSDWTLSSPSSSDATSSDGGTMPKTATCFPSTGTTPHATQSSIQAMVHSTLLLFPDAESAAAPESFTPRLMRQSPHPISSESALSNRRLGRRPLTVG